jgi:precorrin-6Y C5,15-methyltransferase (decarboxylating)
MLWLESWKIMADHPWLTILGIGDNGLDSLSGIARHLFDKAEIIIAPQRVLDDLDVGGRKTVPWTFGVSETISFIQSRRGTPTTILATGDPMHFGIGATLRRSFGEDEMLVIPSPSGFSLAAAKLGWGLQDVATISLHGRAVSGLQIHVVPDRRILSLTSNARTISEAAKLLVDRKYGGSELIVLEHIGGPNEKISCFSADEISSGDHDFADFNMLAIKCVADRHAPILPTLAGLPDDAFLHDGQLTKREIRAATLSMLAPFPGAVLWDVGAGCGSIAIEWMRAAYGTKAFAIEQDETRCTMIRDNALALGVPKLELIEGSVPNKLDGLAKPDAIFIGGALTAEGVFDACWQALDDGKRLVANAVTVQSEAKLFELFQTHGGEMSRIQVARAVPVGRFNGWKPFMPVTIWSVTKGHTSGDIQFGETANGG